MMESSLIAISFTHNHFPSALKRQTEPPRYWKKGSDFKIECALVSSLRDDRFTLIIIVH